MLRNWLGRGLFVLSAAALAGCATLFTGTKDTIRFNSQPEGAKVLIDGIEMGTTPVAVPVTRSLGDKMVTLQMDGYEDRTFVLSNRFNAVSVVNIFFWPGFIIDAVTGSMMEYDRKVYETTLRQRSAMMESIDVDKVVFSDELERNEEGHYLVPPGRVAVVDLSSEQVILAQ